MSISVSGSEQLPGAGDRCGDHECEGVRAHLSHQGGASQAHQGMTYCT